MSEEPLDRTNGCKHGIAGACATCGYEAYIAQRETENSELRKRLESIGVLTDIEQRQRDIGQLARDLFSGMGCDDNPCVKTDLSRAFDRAELFYAEIDKRRAG